MGQIGEDGGCFHSCPRGTRWSSMDFTTDRHEYQPRIRGCLVLQRRQIHAITTSYLLFSDPEENVTIPTLSSFSFSSSSC
ncbi:hypothetical protein EUGRSUZ_J01415 [Eucalyptus grandis]|uniref:Uncharacterized protein n=2 Tax=Eucalyptus grandis TaxID=71139 RepID=A0ACC3J7S4_EUCGR|nr:hypothetical protein EUGRSUZ_J01415 [Eucalyptus grandis]